MSTFSTAVRVTGNIIEADDATADELEQVATNLLAKANQMRRAAALEPQDDGAVIRWTGIAPTRASVDGVGVKTLSYVAVRVDGRWWTTRRNEISGGLPWAALAKRFPQIREGEFELAGNWYTPSK
jgi:hypothetical protein